MVVDAGDPADEVRLVLGLDEDGCVRGEIDGLALGNRELDLGDLRLAAVGVAEFPPARGAAGVLRGAPQSPAGLASPVLAGGGVSGPLCLRPALLRRFEPLDQLQRRVEALALRRLGGGVAPVEEPEGVTGHAVGGGDHRLARGEGEDLGPLGMIAHRLQGEDPKRQVAGVAARSLLEDALEGEVRKGQPHLGRLIVGEGCREVTDLGQSRGEHSSSIDAGGTVSERGEHDHGVTVIGDDEVETVEREVRGDQRTVNLDTPQEMPGRRCRQAAGCFGGTRSRRRRVVNGPVDGRGQRLS